jgi:hypothetical protein
MSVGRSYKSYSIGMYVGRSYKSYSSADIDNIHKIEQQDFEVRNFHTNCASYIDLLNRLVRIMLTVIYMLSVIYIKCVLIELLKNTSYYWICYLIIVDAVFQLILKINPI